MPIADFYFLEPNRVWRNYLGGAALDRMAGAEEPQDGRFPEDWMLSLTRAVNPGREDTGEGLSKLRDADGNIVPLTEVSEHFSAGLYGEKHLARYGAHPAFLLKYLDSAIRLLLQSHPTAEFAREHLNANAGKTEGYYILETRDPENAYIYLGFQHPMERETFKKAVEEQNSAVMLGNFEKIPVRPGDAFLVPGGMPHAIGEGILMVEIMEPSDFVVRLEYIVNGKPLPEPMRYIGGNSDFGMDMVDFNVYTVDDIRKKFFIRPEEKAAEGSARRFSLFDERYTDCFRVDLLDVNGSCRCSLDNSLAVAVIVEGEGAFFAGNTAAAVKKYDRMLIPASRNGFSFEGKGKILVIRPPLP
ncbi:MAG: class I mannose-6-phosphate isomerase [Lentisphaeria bacterium]|nr:class I mannose-6-phosphate isomerase [Lentisphaeria bacterium]